MRFNQIQSSSAKVRSLAMAALVALAAQFAVALPAQAATSEVDACTTGTVVIVDNVVTGQHNCAGALVIPDGVVLIEHDAFREDSLLTSVVVPDSVVEMGYGAFDRAVNLTTVTLGSGVVNIADAAFQADYSLTSINFPSSLRSIGSNAFFASGLASISLNEGLDGIGPSAFERTALTSVTIPDSVGHIGAHAFANINSLTSVTIGSGLDQIEFCTFCFDKALVNVTIGSGVNNILKGAFVGDKMINVTTQATPGHIFGSWNSYSDGVVNSPDLGTYLNVFPYAYLFAHRVTDISGLLITFASGDGGGTPPDTLSGIVNSAPGLGNMVAPAGKDLSGWACSSADGQEINALVGHAITPTADTTCVAQWAATTVVFTSSTNVDDTVTVTGCTANCSGDLVIPDTIGGKPVTSIGSEALMSKGLTSVTIPSSVTSIGHSALADNQLTSVTIPNSVTSIGDFSFYGDRLTSLTIPSSVTSLGAWAFYGNQLTSVTIPDSVTRISNGAFAYNQLTSVTIPDSVTSIGGDTFSNNQLTSLTIPSSVTSIGDGAFRNNQLESLIIPSSVTSLGDWAFYGNPFMSVIFLGDAPADAGDIFKSDHYLTSITVPSDAVGFGSKFSGLIVEYSGSQFHHTVTYNANGGSSVASGSFTTGGSIRAAPVSTRAGYTLSGWSSTAGGSVVDFPYSPTATTDVKLFAIWLLNPVKATYVAGAKVTGKAKKGKSVSVVKGRWIGTASVTYTYQWYSCRSASKKVLTTGKAAAKCKVIKKATKSTFKVTAKEKGTFLAVLITGTNGVGKTKIFTGTLGQVS